MLSLTNVLWVLAYLGIIHLFCLIFSRVSSRSSENSNNDSNSSSQIHEPQSGVPLFEIDDQFHYNHKILPHDDDDDRFHRHFNSKIQPVDDDEDQFHNHKTSLKSESSRFVSEYYNNKGPKTSFSPSPVTVTAGAAPATSKYQFLAGQSFSGYIEQPQSASFKVQELYSDFDQRNDTVSKQFSPPQVYQKNDQDEEHIAISDDSEDEEEDQVIDDADFHDFDDHVVLKTEKTVSSPSRIGSESKEEDKYSGDRGVPKVKESDLSPVEEAAASAVEEIEAEKITSTDKQQYVTEVKEEELTDISPPTSSSVNTSAAAVPLVEETDHKQEVEEEEEISSTKTSKDVPNEYKSDISSTKTSKDIRDADKSDVSTSSEKASCEKEEVDVQQPEEQELAEICSSEKGTDGFRETKEQLTELYSSQNGTTATVRQVKEPEIISSSDATEYFPEVVIVNGNKMTSSESSPSSSSSFLSNGGQSSMAGEIKAAADPQTSENTSSVVEKQEHSLDQINNNNRGKSIMDPKDDDELLSDHDFSVSSESDNEDLQLEQQQYKDELIIFSPDGISPLRKLSFDDFLTESDVFYSLREQEEASPDHAMDEEEKPNDRYYSFNDREDVGSDFDEVSSPSGIEKNKDKSMSGQLGFSDSDEEDELERSFAKSTTIRNDVEEEDIEWLQKAYEDEAEAGQGEEEEDEQDYDVLLEHLATVQKMKKEMKTSRRSSGLGLPTILEEESTESLRMEEDEVDLMTKSVSVTVDEKLEHKDRIDEIQRHYRRYWEKMRRLDMLCHQSMNAIGFMHNNRTQNAGQSTNKSNPWSNLLTPNFCSRKSSFTDPILKLYRNLHRDFELVYVGQLCLSWEILKWQHYKSEELQLYDTATCRRYNHVADAFQQFQILLQRFTEDETYQGPRIQNYVKSRCANRTILQVPLLKDDAVSAAAQRMGEGQQQEISISKLTDIIELSTRTFWEFLRADKKDECVLRLTSCQGLTRTVLEDPADAEMLMNLRSELLKKERKMRAIVKSGNCIVQKFHKQREEERRKRLRHELVIAQVELRLVGRVLDMSRLSTDQLLWCHKKLNKVKFLGRIVHVESSSFLLFPF